MKKKISIISPCLNEIATIEKCISNVTELFSNLKSYDYEHIIVDNGSTDGSREIIEKLALTDKNIKVIFNTRTFDFFKSLFNAIKYATGDGVVLNYTSDLEDPIEVIEKFIQEWEKGNKIVYGKRTARKDQSFIKKKIRNLYYFFTQKILKVTFQKDVNEFMLIDKQVHAELIKIDDHFPYIRGLVNYFGFQSIAVEYEPHKRDYGVSKFSILSHAPHVLNAFISFSNLPRLLIFLGFFISISSITYSIYIILAVTIFNIQLVQGLTTILVSIFFLMGFIIFSLGILGEYLITIHNQVRQKPMVVEEKKINL
jgi:polyisoprenyl-phosphate glycosyltransferase